MRSDEKSRAGYRFLMLLAVSVVASLYYVFNPELGSLFPACPFHRMTGWSCPGCGSQRALHSLLHGDIPAAMRYNALFVVSLPLVTCWWGLKRFNLSSRVRLPRISGLLAYCAIGVIVISFAVFRNLV